MQVLIIGAGVSGLTLAYQLHKQEIDFTVVEARPRPGGRILTSFEEKRPDIPLDYGPTWYWEDHQHIEKLLKELRIARFPQYTTGFGLYDHGPGTTPQQFAPPQSPTSYRIKGGMMSLIHSLYKKLPEDRVHLNTAVTKISADKDGITAEAQHDEKTVFYDADYVVVTLPPALACMSIQYHPRLPEDVFTTLYNTHTWMGRAMKVFVIYDTPFWRKLGLSGYSISHYGVVGEMHDASPAGQPFGVLFGFLSNNSPARNMSYEQRKEAVLNQVKRTYGWQASDYKVYSEHNWTYDGYTNMSGARFADLTELPRYGDPLLQPPVMNDRLFWGASEVSTVSGGYIDGAVYRANEIADAIMEKSKPKKKKKK